MFLYLPLQLPLLAGVVILLLADSHWSWSPIQTEAGQFLIAFTVILLATALAVQLDRTADPHYLPPLIMWSAMLPASILVFGGVRVCLLFLRRRNMPWLRRTMVAGAVGIVAIALAPATALVAGCAIAGECP